MKASSGAQMGKSFLVLFFKKELLAVLLVLAATPARANGDPLEVVNRAVHGFNVAAQRHVLGPAAAAYMAWTPVGVRAGLAGVVANLGEPVTAASALLAGETALAATAAVRFGINSTLGLGGARDVAAGMGYPRAALGLSDALCRWGVPRGPYLVLPLLGPTNLRDAAGMAATSLALGHVVGADVVLAWGAGAGWVEYAAVHSELAGLEARALDGYATLRSVYLQRRAWGCAVDRGEEEASQ